MVRLVERAPCILTTQILNIYLIYLTSLSEGPFLKQRITYRPSFKVSPTSIIDKKKKNFGLGHGVSAL